MINKENTVVFATRNPHKREEYQELLADFLDPMWEIYDLHSFPEEVPEIEEDCETFRENALKKAIQVSHHTGSSTIADDSGLVVDALEGRPGVHSSRFAGPEATDEENNRKLIEELQGVPEKERTARFETVLVFALSGRKVGRNIAERSGVPWRVIGEAPPTVESELAKVDNRVTIWFRGTVEGRIVDEPRGEHGFGYDPHFYVPEIDKTLAEIPMSEKNKISHRAKAAAKIGSFFQRGQ